MRGFGAAVPEGVFDVTCPPGTTVDYTEGEVFCTKTDGIRLEPVLTPQRPVNPEPLPRPDGPGAPPSAASKLGVLGYGLLISGALLVGAWLVGESRG